MCDTCEESDHYAEGYSTCEKNQGRVGRFRLSGKVEGILLLFCLYERFAQLAFRGWLVGRNEHGNNVH